MPKVIDHAERRAEITMAVQRLIDREGLDGLTIAKAAEAAGVSVGQVQHYFASKDALLEATYRQVNAALDARLAKIIAEAVTGREPIRTVILRALQEWLPVDERRLSAHRVTVAFLSRAAANPTLAELHTQTLTTLRDRVAEAVHNGKECGEVPADTNTRAAAEKLLALTDGHALHLGAGAGFDPATALDDLTTAVTAVFPGDCRQWAGR